MKFHVRESDVVVWSSLKSRRDKLVLAASPVCISTVVVNGEGLFSLGLVKGAEMLVKFQYTDPEGFRRTFHGIFWWFFFKFTESYQRGVLLLQLYPLLSQGMPVPRAFCRELRSTLFFVAFVKGSHSESWFEYAEKSSCGCSFRVCGVDYLWADVRHGVQKE
jgi:hypothetical protein